MPISFLDMFSTFFASAGSFFILVFILDHALCCSLGVNCIFNASTASSAVSAPSVAFLILSFRLSPPRSSNAFLFKAFFCFPFVKGVSLLEPALVLVLALALALPFGKVFIANLPFAKALLFWFPFPPLPISLWPREKVH